MQPFSVMIRNSAKIKPEVEFMKRIVLTGGGTAGHVTPNLALLPHLRAEGWEVLYIGSENGNRFMSRLPKHMENTIPLPMQSPKRTEVKHVIKANAAPTAANASGPT